jgi:hypothetical protein
MRKSRRLNIKRRRRSIKGGKPPMKLYQAKLVDIQDSILNNEDITERSEIETYANEFVNKEQNGMNIGDILFCGTKTDRQEYGFYLVLPDGENKVVKCLGEGWGMGWISGGIIDHKDVLNRYDVKYDNLLSQKSGIYEFDMYFLGHIESSMPPQIIEEFKQNKLIS